MKWRGVLLVSVVLAALLLPAVLPPGGAAEARINACPQVVKNGSFEDWGRYWEGYPFALHIVSDVVYDGQRAATFGYKSTYVCMIGRQQLPSSYDDWHLSGYVYISTWNSEPAGKSGRAELIAQGQGWVSVYIITYRTEDGGYDQYVVINVNGEKYTLNMRPGIERWIRIEVVVTDYYGDPTRDAVKVYIDGAEVFYRVVPDIPDVNEVMIRWCIAHPLPGYDGPWLYDLGWRPVFDLIQFYDLGSCT